MKLPPDSRSVARPHKYGNSFPVAQCGRGAALMLYRTWLAGHPDGQKIVSETRRKLRGKNLAWFGRLDEPCHADILLDIANGLNSDGRS